jgi:hypothetical protein
LTDQRFFKETIESLQNQTLFIENPAETGVSGIVKDRDLLIKRPETSKRKALVSPPPLEAHTIQSNSTSMATAKPQVRIKSAMQTGRPAAHSVMNRRRDSLGNYGKARNLSFFI